MSRLRRGHLEPACRTQHKTPSAGQPNRARKDAGGLPRLPIRSHFGDLESFPGWAILRHQGKADRLLFPLYFFAFFSAASRSHEKRSARHSDTGPARGAVCLDLPQTCDRAITLLGRRVDPGPAAFRRAADPGRIRLGTGAGRQPERQRAVSFRAVLPFLRPCHLRESPLGSALAALGVRSSGALLYQLRGLRWRRTRGRCMPPRR